jgi:hypothetical protein
MNILQLKEYENIRKALGKNLSETEKFMDKWEITGYNYAIKYIDWIINGIEVISNLINNSKSINTKI